jgi:hypothetical protein
MDSETILGNNGGNEKKGWHADQSVVILDNSPFPLASRTRALTLSNTTTSSSSITPPTGTSTAAATARLPTHDSAEITTAGIAGDLWAPTNSEYIPAQDHQILPNMFVLDNLSQDPLAEQMMFFYLLNVPDLDNMLNTHSGSIYVNPNVTAFWYVADTDRDCKKEISYYAIL